MSHYQEAKKDRQRRTVDPILTLRVPADTPTMSKRAAPGMGRRSSVSGVCFLGSSSESAVLDSDESSVSSSSDGGAFRCENLVRNERRHDDDVTAGARNAAATMSLHGKFLASCHSNSDAFVWDLGRQRIVSDFGDRRGPGMALRRLGGSSSSILFHTRDEAKTVSIHDTMRPDNPIVVKYETWAPTFCSAAPCTGNQSLVVLPDAKSGAVIRDVRVPGTSMPVKTIYGAAPDGRGGENRKHGMLTSVAMAEAGSTGRLCITCGMESGTLFFHDLGLTQGCEDQTMPGSSDIRSTSIRIGTEAILGCDLSPSPTSSGANDSFVAIAGLAGDAVDLSKLPKAERATVAVIKATASSANMPMSARLRNRMSTCDVGGPDYIGRSGKPGVNLCRFRPDGRAFAVAGWDMRVRLFDRTGRALAILKSHASSVTAIDWAPDVASSLIVTGAGDGRIPIWRCF